MPARRAVKTLFARALQDMIVLNVPARRFQVPVFFFGHVAVGFLENIVLQLGPGLGRIPHGFGLLHLAPQNGPGRETQELPGFGVMDIAHDHGGFFQPADAAQR